MACCFSSELQSKSNSKLDQMSSRCTWQVEALTCLPCLMQVLVGIVLVSGVANRVLYKAALIPMHNYTWFLAQVQNVAYLTVYFGALALALRSVGLPSACAAGRVLPTACMSPCSLSCLVKSKSKRHRPTQRTLDPALSLYPRLNCLITMFADDVAWHVRRTGHASRDMLEIDKRPFLQIGACEAASQLLFMLVST